MSAIKKLPYLDLSYQLANVFFLNNFMCIPCRELTSLYNVYATRGRYSGDKRMLCEGNLVSFANDL